MSRLAGGAPDLRPRKVVRLRKHPVRDRRAPRAAPGPRARDRRAGSHGDRPPGHPAPACPARTPSFRCPEAAPLHPGKAGSRTARGTHVPARPDPPGPGTYGLTQIASSSPHAGPARAIPAAAAHGGLRSPLWLPRPLAPPRTTTTATSQPLPASEFPVPRLPKHARLAGRGCGTGACREL